MKIAILLLLIAISEQIVSSNLTIHLHTHSWCPPCRKARSIFHRLQQSYPQIIFQTHNYSGRAILATNSTNKTLPYPTIIFQCNSHKFTYQNDLSFSQLSYWIDVVCLNQVPLCSDKINEELYRILIQKTDFISHQLVQEMLRHPHIKICGSPSSNISQSKAIETLKSTDTKSLYFDYFSNNLRNYLIQSQKLVVAIVTSEKNTSKVNAFLQAYISIGNFMNQQNQTKQIFHYELPEAYKQQLAFMELCCNLNVSKCIYDADRKIQVQNSYKMVERLLHFFDINLDNVGNFDQIIAFRFTEPVFEKHVYHNFGAVDQKFLFWIKQLLEKREAKTKEENMCLWNSITHRVSENSLEDIESYNHLQQFTKGHNTCKIVLNRINKSYHSQPKITVCLQGQEPIYFERNQVQKVINLFKSSQKAQSSEL